MYIHNPKSKGRNMKPNVFVLLLTALAVCPLLQAGEEGWNDLFDGRTLTGWTNVYDWGEAKVVDGEIQLTADKKFFLCTEKTYSDFIFEAEVKLPEGKSNSGFMFRCH